MIKCKLLKYVIFSLPVCFLIRMLGVLLKLQWHQNHLVKTRMAGLHQFLITIIGLGVRGHKNWSSNKFPGDADAAVLGSHF